METGRVKLSVLGVTYSHLQQQGAYVLLLLEEGGKRRVPIVVGTAEAQSIAISLENVTPQRPLTHDLIAKISRELGAEFDEVYIYRFEKGVFYSTLTLHNAVESFTIDSRTSDAIAIALRVGIPIYMAADVLQKTGFEITKEGDEVSIKVDNNFDQMSNAELKARIEQAVAIEDYEEAARIQQVLKERQL